MVDFLSVNFLFQLLQSLVIILSAFIFVKVINKLLRRFFDEKNVDKKRALTNIRRFIELISYLIVVVLVFWTFNVDVTGLIAGLGVGALIIGFALKDVIENWVSGLLIMSDKTYKVGDVISVGNTKGTVTHLSLRTTTLKSYDRNDIIFPNSVLLKERIVNLTSGKKETVISLVYAIDFVFDVEQAKNIIRNVLLSNEFVVFDEKRQREIRFLVRVKEWATEIEVLFWINPAENEEFIKSEILEKVKKEMEAHKILPPLPAVLRKEYIESIKATK